MSDPIQFQDTAVPAVPHEQISRPNTIESYNQSNWSQQQTATARPHVTNEFRQSEISNSANRSVDNSVNSYSSNRTETPELEQDVESVLVESSTTTVPPVTNQLRVEPKRLKNANLRNYRNSRRDAVYYQEGIQEFEGVDKQLNKTCEDFRSELLDDPISNIVVDKSPYPPKATAEEVDKEALTRTWTDCFGQEVGRGTLVGLRRSYIVIMDENDQEQLISKSRLSDADLAIVTQFWGLPTECTLGCYNFEGRSWAANTMHWKASALCHKPLYFENIQLERYGHSNGPVLEPLRSTAHFFVSLISVPYQSGIHPANECVYALGYFRPGNCAPWLREPLPISLAGTVRQAAYVAALGAIIP